VRNYWASLINWTPVIRPQTHAAIKIGIPIITNERSAPTIAMTICQMPAFVFPAIREPRPGIMIKFRISATTASGILFFLGELEDFFLGVDFFVAILISFLYG
jgi:hypothetical protein